MFFDLGWVLTEFVLFFLFFFFNDTATTEIYTLSLHDALPISSWRRRSMTCRQRSIACSTWSHSWTRRALYFRGVPMTRVPRGSGLEGGLPPQKRGVPMTRVPRGSGLEGGLPPLKRPNGWRFWVAGSTLPPRRRSRSK